MTRGEVEPGGPAADDERLARALAAIDVLNAEDPTVALVRGERHPKELAHGRLATEWVRSLDPQATAAQLIAARAHHLRRWTIPRSSEPEGRAGYLRWRIRARRQHADEVAAVLLACGWDEATIGRVQAIIRKEGLGRDPQVQTHEDALCLVFLETQLAEMVQRLGADRVGPVLAKTAARMSAEARERAWALPLRPEDRALLAGAVEGLELSQGS